MDTKELINIPQLEEFISQYPIYEYRILDASKIEVFPRARTICSQECSRYGSTWACPPAVGTIEECGQKIKGYHQAVFFSSVAEVSDLFNMEEMLSTRKDHEQLTTELGNYLKDQGLDIYILSTESCDICERCAYLDGQPCRHPEYMHPCLESHGILVSLIAEETSMEYDLGGNTILWFSMILVK